MSEENIVKLSDSVSIVRGDCLDVLRTMPDNSVESVVTDPPYGLRMMNKKWDYDVPSEDIWRECLRVLKPGGHLLAFAGTRTQHRMACRIEDAGFEIRDMLMWVYSTGFPKSLNVSKAIDKAAGAEREVVGPSPHSANRTAGAAWGRTESEPERNITAPATDAAKQWDGWGTALKPALEPITVARKPLIGTVAANVLAHGTGAINIHACRVESGGTHGSARSAGAGAGYDAPEHNGPNRKYGHGIGGILSEPHAAGRWPANLIHDGSEEVVGLFPVTGVSSGGVNVGNNTRRLYQGGWRETGANAGGLGDSGSASRFFKCCPPDPLDAPDAKRLFCVSKASKRDRDEGCEGLEAKNNMRVNAPRESEEAKHQSKGGNHHPTVKPTDLMRYLCRLVTFPGGIVLDPFMGSGSTGKAAIREGFGFLGIERDTEYFEIARARLENELRQGRLPLEYTQ